MSPDSGKPEAQTQIGSDKFVGGIHPVEGVQPFKQGDLPDVHEELLERGVPDTVTIHPETLEVPVDKIPLPTPETETPKKSRKGLLIGLGSAAAGVGVAVSAFLGLSGHDADAPKAQPTVSASPNPGEATQPAPVEVSDPDLNPSTSPETRVGTPSTTFDTLNVQPSEELRNSVKPVTTAEFSEPAAAVAQFGKLMNLRYLGGMIDYPNTGLNETAASIADRDKIDAVIFENGKPQNFDDENNLRLLIATDFYQINELKSIPTKETPTYHVEWQVGDVAQTNQFEYTVQVVQKVSTNLLDIDPSLINNVENLANQNPDGSFTPIDYAGTVTIVQKDGEWHVRELAISQPVGE